MVRATEALKRPFTTVQQVWEDYQVGRAIRRMPTIVLPPDMKEEWECKEKRDKECEKDNNKGCKDETPNDCGEGCEEDCQEVCQEKNDNFNKDQCKDKARSPPVRDEERAARKAAQLKRSWRYWKGHEFPWVLCQTVCEESNWKGSWVLQVKDMKAMDWGVEVLPLQLKKGEKFVCKPTRQLPFPFGEESSVLPSEGGQDDMMVWLGKS
ncbi:hypothetical protein GGI42DRAFT_325671 [Trichoderma sp. SZMC 28013]